MTAGIAYSNLVFYCDYMFILLQYSLPFPRSNSGYHSFASLSMYLLLLFFIAPPNPYTFMNLFSRAQTRQIACHSHFLLPWRPLSCSPISASLI